MKMIHVFGTQWSHWGTTYLINTETFANDTKYVKVIEHLPNLNFVKTIKARATNCLYNVYLIDFKNHNTELQKDILKQKSLGKSLITVNYQNNYFDTLRYIVDNLIDSFDKFIWVCSTICNNESLDFSYICDPFSQEQLHVFPSNNQKYGDTFLINVKKFKDHASSMAALVDYPKINFNYSMRVKRLPAPEFVTGETHISYMQDDYDFPYAIYKTEDNKNIAVIDEEPISLWQESDKNIKIYSKGGTVISAPKEVKSKITKELYDYPYVSKSNRILKSKRMDVVFVSNNETNAEKRYELLCQTLGYAPKWVNGVTGRETALKKAASLSDTDWVLVIPGKLEISKAFDFDWQPDRLQEPKHYIFYATNPVNKLCYGHMAPVMYNKRLVLETEQYGIDFTLSKLHQVIPVTAGIARYNLDPLMTWRTAFREAIKLKLNDDVESTERLDTWLHEGEGLNAEYSKFGAVDGVDYFNLVQGNNEELMKTFRWDWLENYFTKKYKNEQ